MKLVLSDEQKMLKEMAEGYLKSSAGIEQLRKLRDSGDADGFDRATWKEMAEMGWAGVLTCRRPRRRWPWLCRGGRDCGGDGAQPHRLPFPLHRRFGSHGAEQVRLGRAEDRVAGQDGRRRRDHDRRVRRGPQASALVR